MVEFIPAWGSRTRRERVKITLSFSKGDGALLDRYVARHNGAIASQPWISSRSRTDVLYRAVMRLIGRDSPGGGKRARSSRKGGRR